MNDVSEIEMVHNFNINPETREIYLVNWPSDENPGVDHRMAQNFIKNINLLESISKDPIIIHMHSIGGSWFDGMAIFDRIQASECETTIVAYGYAESMSGIILQAAKKRYMSKNAYFMLHYGSDGTVADVLSFQNYSNFAKKQSDIMFDIYAENCAKSEFFSKKSKQQIISFLKKKLKSGDWYLSSQDAVKYGFIDDIIQ